jgi:hypothetical protein
LVLSALSQESTLHVARGFALDGARHAHASTSRRSALDSDPSNEIPSGRPLVPGDTLVRQAQGRGVAPGTGVRIEEAKRHNRSRQRDGQYFPIDADPMDWAFGEDIRTGHIRSAFDIRDVWPSSYSANTNEILWGAKVAARIPWIACVIRMVSYECGMDQPTYTPVQQIVERSSTLFFSFPDLDSTKPAGSVKIRVETITHYLEKYAGAIIEKKKAAMPPGYPLLPAA